MKTIWGLIVVVCFAAVLFGGISLVNNEILANNPANLNNHSKTLIAKYDDNVSNIMNNLSSAKIKDTSLGSNSTSGVDAFFREAAETKNNIEKTRNAVTFIWDLPSIILLSVPFINVESNAFFSLVNGIVYLLISVLILFVLIKGLKGKVDNEV